MRATMRITCLLLSLSFLFHNVCSNGDGTTATSVTKNAASVTPEPSAVLTGGSASGTEPTTDSKVGVTVCVTTGAHPTDDDGKTNEPKLEPITAKPTTAVTVTPVPTAATSKLTDKQNPTQPQAPTVTNKPAPPTVISDASPAQKNVATPPAATPSQPKTLTPAATADSRGGSVVSPNSATLQTPVAPVPSKTSGTEVTVGNPANAGTTKIAKVSTDTPAPGQQSMTHTPITTKSSQDSKGGTEETTVKIPSHKHTASMAPVPAGNKGTTSSPSTMTKAGPLAAETSVTKAGPYLTSPQTATTTTTTVTTVTTTTTAAQPKTFLYSLNKGREREDEKDLVEVCKRLMVNLEDGNCTLTWQHHNGKIQLDCVEINGKVKSNLATQYYEEITKKPADNKTLIAILASCGALLIMIVILAVCASHHRRPYNENQQHLTEELHTVENGYHDNPTLEVMEVQPEMQEKKVALNGEFNDSWIVPIDNLLKEDIPDEEDTHL